MDVPTHPPAIKFLDFKVLNSEFELGSRPGEYNGDEVIVDLGYGVGFDPKHAHFYAVQIDLVLTESKSGFRLMVKAIAQFQTQDPIDETFQQSLFVRQNSPAIAFPYLRAFVSTFTTNVGMPAIVLPTYNFSR